MKHVALALVALTCVLTASPLPAQVGNNNPAGQSGIFNGQAGGCGYDPYTGNATRSITDIAVAGAVGEYPLALVRTANSRTLSTTGVFGWQGGWNHSYNWTMDDSPVANTQNSLPKKYTVNFPDGRVETLRAVTWDTVYRVRPGADTPAQSTSNGVRERFLQLNLNNMYGYLILTDGGAVEFRAQQNYDPNYGRYWYTYRVTGIYDPHGLKTTIDSEVTGTIRRITRVTEPAGRYLQFSYAPNDRRRITQITEYINGVARRIVQYNYNGLGWLTSVLYYGNSAWTARYQYTASNVPDLPMLLSTCDDPMYLGPMKRIAYEYKPGGPSDPNNPDGTRPVYGQILRERYWDGVSGPTTGAMISELTVGESPNITYKRKETRGDSKTRTFIYSGAGYINWIPDFMGHSAQQHYDSTTKYVDYVVDRRGNRTDYSSDSITGNVTQIQLPLTNGNTPGQGQTRPAINYTYTNSYYLHTIQDEGGNTTTIWRDPDHNRFMRIDYPDSGYETFSYDAAHLYQIQNHRMVTGGVEAWTYDSRHRTDTYCSPDSPSPSPNPSARYQYDNYDRVSDVTDVLGASAGDANHTISFAHNLRAQITSITSPIFNGSRHTLAANIYNNDGTPQSTTDPLGHITSYTYDDYHRLKSVILPDRGDNAGTHTTRFYYGANASDSAADYQYTDSNVTYTVLPSTKKMKTNYDDNRRTHDITVAWNSNDAATTSYGYDAVGNLASVSNPLNHNNVSTAYDERNRPSSVTVGGVSTAITYDTAGRRKTIIRQNGQIITNENFDEMNRVTRQSTTQSPTGTARTNYSYYPGSGLLHTFQDPHIYMSDDSGEHYSYTYDGMGRKKTLTYPAEPVTGAQRVERWTYDNAGRLGMYTARANQHQNFVYDSMNRITDFTWDDNFTPNGHFTYDAASRLTNVNNTNANITRAYYNDNLLRSEAEQIVITGGRSKTTSYTYDADGNRANTTYPDNGYSFGYTYTDRNQLKTVNNWASCGYDARGNVTTRSLPGNGTSSECTSYDVHDRVQWITHHFSGNATRSFNYGYATDSNDCLWIRRLGSTLGDVGDAFSYDDADQAIAVQHNVARPQNVPQPITPQNIYYDSNGNRTWYAPPGINKQYDPPQGVASNLNQYTSAIINGSQYNLSYFASGNLGQYGYNNSSYSYDAQNRLISANVGGQSMSLAYDGLNRQISRTVNGGAATFSVWDGWDLIEEYQAADHGAATAFYLYGTTGLIAGVVNGQIIYYFQDASGSTSHVTDANGNLVEWYRYDVQGTPFFYNASDNQLTASGLGVRHLFTGQQWYQDIGLYDLRNRFYSPDLGRFLQPDPIGFRGGNHLYRYCRNNPVTRWDPFGLQDAVTLPEGFSANVPEVRVNSSDPIDRGGTGAPSGGGGGGGSGEAGGGNLKMSGFTFSYGKPPQNSNSNTQQQPPGIMVPFDIYHPQTTAEFIIAGNIIEGGDTTDTTPAIDLVNLFSWGIAGLARSSISSVAAKGMYTPYGRALQSTTAEAQAALRQIRGGATVYKGGVLGRSETSASQFLSLESPLNPGYASRYGIPPQNTNFNFILSGRVQPGAPLITRPAAGVASNIEAGIEGVTTPGSFIMDSFYMPE